MKIFISWSGERSKQVAVSLDVWLRRVLQNTKPWVSPNIEGGANWYLEVSSQLAAADYGIICLTQENKNNPWILFETGALVKGLNKNKVVPLLIDIEKASDVQGPLSTLQSIFPTKEGINKLVTEINQGFDADHQVSIADLSETFELYWPRFKEKLDSIITETQQTDVKEKRPVEDVMEEILSTVRSINNQSRDNVTVEPHPLAALFKLDYLNLANPYYGVIEKNIMSTLFDTDYSAKPDKHKENIENLSIIFSQQLNMDISTAKLIVTDVFKKRFNYKQD